MTATERVLAHFARISEAPDAIPRLRRFILDLAVRGKLVDQDPSDEPASHLIERIRAERARTTALGAGASGRTRRTASSVSNYGKEAVPFPVPASWCWSSLSEVGQISPRNVASDAHPASFVPMTLISADYGTPNQHEPRPWGEIKSGYTHFANGDVALAKITPCFENGKSTVFRNLTGGFGAGTTELHVVRPTFVDADYIVIFLKSPSFIERGIPRMTGTAGQKRVSADYFALSPFPLPPLDEQRRIVGRVGQLMALCESLEAAQKGRESTRDQLVSASLARLGQPTDRPSFAEYARFHLDHLPRMTVSRGQLQQLRQLVLNLAVRGLLVRQDPEGMPVDVDVEAAALRPLAKREFQLPVRWRLATLERIAEAIVDCPHSTPKWTIAGKLCVRTNQFRPGQLDLAGSRFVSEATYIQRIERLKPAEDDILYSREGGILGVACRVPPGVELCLGQRMMLIRAARWTRPDYLEMVLNSPWITTIAKEQTTGGAAPRINVATVKAFPIPVPPLAEQQRIVARVQKLMAACDALEAKLEAARDARVALLDTTLRDALRSREALQSDAELAS